MQNKNFKFEKYIKSYKEVLVKYNTTKNKIFQRTLVPMSRAWKQFHIFTQRIHTTKHICIGDFVALTN